MVLLVTVYVHNKLIPEFINLKSGLLFLTKEVRQTPITTEELLCYSFYVKSLNTSVKYTLDKYV